jgi:hypothetical protein
MRDMKQDQTASVSLPEVAKMQPDELGQIRRPARALLGWMKPQAAHTVQLGGRADVTAELGQIERAESARDTVRARATGVDQSDVVLDLPSSLNGHIAALRGHAALAPYFEEGWVAGMADLTRICAIQPHIYTDDAEQRVAGVDPSDLLSIAAVSLPEPVPSGLPAQYDPVRKTWMLAAPNPNLQVVGNFSSQIPPGVMGFGFGLAVLPSVLQVAEFEGRYLLRDGYHRAYGFLGRGITSVPAFVRSFSDLEELAIGPGMLPHDAFLGDRPPLLPDYLDDSVAVDVELPAFQKMIVIQALELTPMS